MFWDIALVRFQASIYLVACTDWVWHFHRIAHSAVGQGQKSFRMQGKVLHCGSLQFIFAFSAGFSYFNPSAVGKTSTLVSFCRMFWGSLRLWCLAVALDSASPDVNPEACADGWISVMSFLCKIASVLFLIETMLFRCFRYTEMEGHDHCLCLYYVWSSHTIDLGELYNLIPRA